MAGGDGVEPVRWTVEVVDGGGRRWCGAGAVDGGGGGRWRAAMVWSRCGGGGPDSPSGLSLGSRLYLPLIGIHGSAVTQLQRMWCIPQFAEIGRRCSHFYRRRALKLEPGYCVSYSFGGDFRC